MAITNLKDFNNEFILFGFLFFSMMTFTILFMANNNVDGLGNTADKFDSSIVSVQSNLLNVDNGSNELLNISAKQNPQVSFLGSRDSVAISYGFFGNAKNFLDSFKLFMGWILIGTAGQMITAVIVGMFGLTSLYWITKYIRTGS